MLIRSLGRLSAGGLCLLATATCFIQTRHLGFLTRSPATARVLRFATGLGQQQVTGRGQFLKMSSTGGGGVDNPMNPQIYTEKAWDSIAKLPQYAKKYSTQYAEASLILRGLLDDGPSGLAQRVIQKAGADYATIEKNLEDHLQKLPKVSDTSNISMGRSMNDVLAKASQLKRDFGDQFISVEHLLLAAADTDGITKKVFLDGGSNLTKLKAAVMEIRGTNKVTSRNPEVSYEALKQYSRDLTAAAAEGKLDPVIGRDEEIRRAIQILSRRTKNNPILLGTQKSETVKKQVLVNLFCAYHLNVTFLYLYYSHTLLKSLNINLINFLGEPGVGKTAIAEGLAQRIISGDVPETLKGRKLMSLDMGALIAGECSEIALIVRSAENSLVVLGVISNIWSCIIVHI